MRAVARSLQTLTCCLLLFMGTLTGIARAELTIEITRGNDQAVPVAVVPFAWNGRQVLPEDIAGIIGNDLRLSGQFAPVPSSQFLGFPSKSDEVFFGDWNRLGVSYLVIGSVTEQPDNRYRVSYELFDVAGKRSVVKGDVTGSRNQLRSIAHNISDSVYQKITGIRGAFSTRLVYVVAKRYSENNTDYKLVYADVDGMRAVTVLKSKKPILAPSWSPDGKKIAYVSFETGRPAIYIQELATGNRERISSFRGLNSVPKWSPDGKKLAVVLSKSGNPDIYVLDLQTRKLTQVTRHFAMDNEPDWMPDGKSLVFSSNRGGSAQIYQVELASGEIKRLTFEGRFNSRPKVFPDGKSMALIHKGKGQTDYNVAVLEFDTGRMRILSSSPFEDAPDISPNGRMLIYAAQGGDQGVLGIISADGRVSFRLPSTEGDVREPAWSPFLN
ncbi:Tol-Pal system beta propeller repeat protein TolB [Sansalvadorimonas sp. 2012CJ34-2]|uniref:Tol-Pal system protein TolB n=1 Tax=Parendozoicomonas callyspongiae TaxID=2942213 RepID=A0ABT0PFU3_9GAMM|nr:Tol-Pal system beta propeller repeat protein TolB [Sansalvadorimonas sp. 2012CJ34-2]MCL6270244.1 Tol-Pal system beta propeller repeat protein TolB [Sansalvadorimonas sp. 2012CJ34-2]